MDIITMATQMILNILFLDCLQFSLRVLCKRNVNYRQILYNVGYSNKKGETRKKRRSNRSKNKIELYQLIETMSTVNLLEIHLVFNTVFVVTLLLSDVCVECLVQLKSGLLPLFPSFSVANTMAGDEVFRVPKFLTQQLNRLSCNDHNNNNEIEKIKFRPRE